MKRIEFRAPKPRIGAAVPRIRGPRRWVVGNVLEGREEKVGEEVLPAWTRTLMISSGLPIMIPIAPAMELAQKSADMVVVT